MNLFTQKELEKYAAVMLWAVKKERSGKFEKYDNFLIRYDALALPLAREIHKKLVQERFNVSLKCTLDEVMAKDFYSMADDAQLKFIAAGDKEFYSASNGLIALHAPASLTHLKDVDPARMAASAAARKPIRKIWDDREQQGKFGWTIACYPSQAAAAQAGLTLKQYAAQIKKACFLSEDDPVKKWVEVTNNTEQIGKKLTALNMDTINLQSKNCDLTIKLGDSRKFLSGRGANIPSFEVFTSPDCRAGRGVYYADMPTYRSGVLCKGVRLEFKDGHLTKTSASLGANFVKKMTEMDPGASRIGEFSLTDKRFSNIDRFMADTMFDENFGGKHGNSHIALGQSYTDTYTGPQKALTPAKKKALGYNESSLHWDLVNTEDKIVKAKLKNGKTVTIYENGMFNL